MPDEPVVALSADGIMLRVAPRRSEIRGPRASRDHIGSAVGDKRHEIISILRQTNPSRPAVALSGYHDLVGTTTKRRLRPERRLRHESDYYDMKVLYTTTGGCVLRGGTHDARLITRDGTRQLRSTHGSSQKRRRSDWSCTCIVMRNDPPRPTSFVGHSQEDPLQNNQF